MPVARDETRRDEWGLYVYWIEKLIEYLVISFFQCGYLGQS
jgi:hypothetical protein